MGTPVSFFSHGLGSGHGARGRQWGVQRDRGRRRRHPVRPETAPTRSTARAATDLLCGGNGADTVAGGAGDDTLDGGRGPDRLAAGPGADGFGGGQGKDVAADLTPAEGDTQDGNSRDPGRSFNFASVLLRLSLRQVA